MFKHIKKCLLIYILLLINIVFITINLFFDHHYLHIIASYGNVNGLTDWAYVILHFLGLSSLVIYPISYFRIKKLRISRKEFSDLEKKADKMIEKSEKASEAYEKSLDDINKFKRKYRK